MDRTSAVTETYAKACISIAEKTGCPVVDCYSLFSSIANLEAMFCDGLHFSPEGNENLFKWVNSTIEQNFDHFRWE